MSESSAAAETVTDVSQLFPEVRSAPVWASQEPTQRTRPILLDFLPPASVLCSVGAFVAVTGFGIFTMIWYDLQQSGIGGTTLVGKGLSTHPVPLRIPVSISIALGVLGMAVFVLGLVKRTTEDGEF